MISKPKIKYNQSVKEDILSHFMLCNNDFKPSLSALVDLEAYSQKLFDNANRLEVWEKDQLVGFMAFYLNFVDGFGYISNVSVLKEYAGKGLAQNLLDGCSDFLKAEKINELRLEVRKENKRALAFYRKNDFDTYKDEGMALVLIKKL